MTAFALFLKVQTECAGDEATLIVGAPTILDCMLPFMRAVCTSTQTYVVTP